MVGGNFINWFYERGYNERFFLKIRLFLMYEKYQNR